MPVWPLSKPAAGQQGPVAFAAAMKNERRLISGVVTQMKAVKMEISK